MTEKGTSVLAKLTSEVMGEKRAAAAPGRTLTPVAGEAHPLDRTTAVFPNDHPKEVIVASVVVIRRELEHIEAALAAVEAELKVEAPVEPTVKDVKAAEKAADAKAADPAFADRFAKLKTEAEAATYQLRTGDVSDAQLRQDWVCPKHGKAVTKTSTVTGRSFIGCPDCNLFKR